jgi:hypothetical protein
MMKGSDNAIYCKSASLSTIPFSNSSTALVNLINSSELSKIYPYKSTLKILPKVSSKFFFIK